MIRKVTLSASEVGFANKNGIKLEDVAKAKLPKRGRPVGSKNKPKIIKMLDVQVKEGKKKVKEHSPTSFEDALKEWDRMENKVNYKELCEKLQEALAKSYVEAEQFERKVAELRNEVAARDVIINYLESRRL
jgi:hypothetical protein